MNEEQPTQTIPPAPTEPGEALNTWLAVNLIGGELGKQQTLWIKTPRKDDTKKVEFTRDWTPSTSSALAMDEIVPAMKAKGWFYRLDEDDDGHHAEFYFPEKEKRVRAIHSTAAGAICLAAAKALAAEANK